MNDPAPSLAPLTLTARTEQMFPTLSPALIARIAPHARRRSTTQGEVLYEAGDTNLPFFVVTAGQAQVVRPSESGDNLVTLLGPGQFSGEVSMLTGRPTLVRATVTQAGEVLEVTRAKLLSLVQTDSEVGEILMRAFILRRVELIARGFGDVVLIGSNFCAGTLRVKQFLTRNGHPYTYLDLDREPDVQSLLDRFQVSADDVPVTVCRGAVLKNPTNAQIAECLGFNASVDSTHLRDLVIVGAGPAGLAAAVYAASEGLNVLMIESSFPGGQAGASSKIENYLGFPTGISGQALTGRALAQAEKFGAQVLVAKGGVRLHCDRRPYGVEIDDGSRVPTRSIVIATGAEYRRPALEHRERFEGAGVYYAASFMEAQLCAGEEVIVVGGGNSAGQAAVFLSQHARHVHILVRSPNLAASMSRYLVRRIEENPKTSLRTRTEIVGLEGDSHLERVRWRGPEGEETRSIRHIFVMTGAMPSTQWLAGCLALDEHGFIRTGSGLVPESVATWPLARRPFLLESSLPGVFAVGDVRAGSIKRVASAVGEGSIAISFVHQVLAE